MMEPSEPEFDAYVRAALALQGYTLDAACAAAVTLQFARIAGIAAAYLDHAPAAGAEPLPVFRP